MIDPDLLWVIVMGIIAIVIFGFVIIPMFLEDLGYKERRNLNRGRK